MSPTFGPLYFGTVVSLVLGGITVLQAYIYFPHPSDRTYIQLVAGAMAVFDFVSTCLVVQSVYYYMIPHFGSLDPLASITPELSAECLLSTIITLISQLYFVVQLHADSPKAVFSVLAFVFGVACVATMYVFHHNVLGNRHSSFELFFGLAKGFGALTDIVATIAMCKLLSEANTGIRQTHGLLKSLIHFVVQRGVLVTLIQTLLLITFFTIPSNLTWLAFHVNVTKLYANTFFAMLNAREHLKARHAVTSTSSTAVLGSRFSSKQANVQAPKDVEAHAHDQGLDFSDGKAYVMNAMPTVTKTVVIADL
ncbi:hypothetical protein ONZ45_g3844 [Pleurotus djamor]|nr:hypothetical protein ONZ45_g3844 [Pleurotus djamor]